MTVKFVVIYYLKCLPLWGPRLKSALFVWYVQRTLIINLVSSKNQYTISLRQMFAIKRINSSHLRIKYHSANEELQKKKLNDTIGKQLFSFNRFLHTIEWKRLYCMNLLPWDHDARSYDKRWTSSLQREQIVRWYYHLCTSYTTLRTPHRPLLIEAQASFYR